MSLGIAESLADNFNFLAHHKSGIETDTELTDYVNVLFLFIVLFKVKRAALGDRTEVGFKLLPRHSDTVIGNCKSSRFLIRLDFDCQIASVERKILLKRMVIKLVHCIARIRNKLTQENFLVSIN